MVRSNKVSKRPKPAQVYKPRYLNNNVDDSKMQMSEESEDEDEHEVSN